MMGTLATDHTPACAGADVDWFFLGEAETFPQARDRLRLAAAMYCAHCPVRDTCADDAHRLRLVGLFGGIWFGNQPYGDNLRGRNLLAEVTPR